MGGPMLLNFILKTNSNIELLISVDSLAGRQVFEHILVERKQYPEAQDWKTISLQFKREKQSKNWKDKIRTFITFLSERNSLNTHLNGLRELADVKCQILLLRVRQIYGVRCS
jgi:hypothetical protein